MIGVPSAGQSYALSAIGILTLPVILGTPILRMPIAGASSVFIKINGAYTPANLFVKKNGTYQAASPHVKLNGGWVAL
jgi:hypothetical protein